MIDRYFMVYSNEDGMIYADKDIDGDYILYEDYIVEKASNVVNPLLADV